MENIDPKIFAGTKGTRGAKILIVGEAYGKQEAAYGRPFVGESGQDLDALIAEAGIPYNECFFTNVVNERPYNNEMTRFFYTNAEAKKLGLTPTRGLFPRPNVLAGIANLRQLVAVLNPELIIGFGNYSLWALTDECFDISNKEGVRVPAGITKWRGSQLRTSSDFGERKFLPTYHPAAALRTFPWRRMIQHDLAVRVPQALADDWTEPTPDFTVRPGFEKTTQFLQDILCHLAKGPTRVVLDLETSLERISCAGFALSSTAAFCIPFTTISGRYWSLEEEVIIIELLHDILLHPNMRLEGQNLLYDLQYIYQDWFIKPRIDFDTMIAHHTIWPGGGDPSSAKAATQGVQMKALFNIASLYCRYYYYWKDEGKDFGYTFDETRGWNYNCRDCIKTFESATELRRLVGEFGQADQFAMQMRVANDMLLPMMIRGVLRDDEETEQVKFQLKCAEFDLESYLWDLLPEDITPKTKSGGAPWYDSASKLSKLFYEVLGMKPILGKTGNPTTSKQALPTLGLREPIIKPITDMIEIKRSIGVYYSTFLEMESDPDGRIRSSYKPTGTDTFRLASSENAFGRGGNLQNIPSGKETDIEVDFKFPNVRKQFVPDPGYEIAEFDLSGADAQVVAWEANDDDLKAAFRAGLKLHLKNARDVYPDKTRDMSDKDITEGQAHEGGIYSNVKKLAHGTNFGGSAKGLAERIRISIRDAEEFQERWFFLHPGIKTWHQKTEQKLAGFRCWKCEDLTDGKPYCPHCGAFPQGRTIGNKFGNRIVYFERVRDLFNAALAWTPQSTTAINCNRGALAIVDKCPWVELLMQVHDSLIVQYPIEYHDLLPEVGRALHSVIVPYSDPLIIPWSAKISRTSWGDCEKYSWPIAA